MQVATDLATCSTLALIRNCCIKVQYPGQWLPHRLGVVWEQGVYVRDKQQPWVRLQQPGMLANITPSPQHCTTPQSHAEKAVTRAHMLRPGSHPQLMHRSPTPKQCRKTQRTPPLCVQATPVLAHTEGATPCKPGCNSLACREAASL